MGAGQTEKVLSYIFYILSKLAYALVTFNYFRDLKFRQHSSNVLIFYSEIREEMLMTANMKLKRK